MDPDVTRQLDVVAIGNAVVDVIAVVDDAFLIARGIAKGSMRPIDPVSAVRLYDAMPPAREASGGSAANTMAGLAALGGRAAFIGQVADDQLGAIFRHDISAQGVRFDTPALPGALPTGRCLILVTPDGQRSMSTALGAAEFLPPAAVDERLIAGAGILLIEGYMLRAAETRAACFRAAAIARVAGRMVALSPSAEYCTIVCRADIERLIADGVDLLFANEAELLSMTGAASLAEAAAVAARRIPIVVATRGARGAACFAEGGHHEVPAIIVPRVVDTTGAGDMFAAAFLAGFTAGRPIPAALQMGARAAAEAIGHFGARPETDLAALMRIAD